MAYNKKHMKDYDEIKKAFNDQEDRIEKTTEVLQNKINDKVQTKTIKTTTDGGGSVILDRFIPANAQILSIETVSSPIGTRRTINTIWRSGGLPRTSFFDVADGTPINQETVEFVVNYAI